MKRICEPVCEKTRKRNLALKRVKVMLQLRHRWENGLRYTQDKKFLHALAKNFYYAKIFSLLLCKKNQSSSSSQRPTQRTVNDKLNIFCSFVSICDGPGEYFDQLPLNNIPVLLMGDIHSYLLPTMIPTYNDTYLQ